MFDLIKKDTSSKARLGRLTLTHGCVDTPVFMSVGTQATVKALDPRELLEMGTQIILGNTYHLALRPGIEIIKAAGGLHSFMNWQLPLLTDSGGFQVFSLAQNRSISDEGVRFQSHLDGNVLFLGPAEAMQLQRELGSDIAMVFDECPGYGSSENDVACAVKRTTAWAKVCRDQPRADGQKVFGIVQGAHYPHLREQSAKELVPFEFDGYAVGGISVGEPEHEMFAAVEMAEPHLPESKPRYAMGLGTPAQLVELVARGIDMFDCILPTTVARNGTAYTSRGAINVKSGFNKADFSPLEEGCSCYACRNFTKAYLRHLLNASEILGLRMLSVHNTHFYLTLMSRIRESIASGTFAQFRRAFIENYRPSKNILSQRATQAQ